LFESVQAETPSARFRSAAFAPLGAVLLTVIYLTVYPLLPRVPAALFWSVVALLLLGTVAGAVAIIRALRNGRPHGTPIGWLVAAVAIELICARLFLWFTFPWL
jgi:hypothetical protein